MNFKYLNQLKEDYDNISKSCFANSKEVDNIEKYLKLNKIKDLRNFSINNFNGKNYLVISDIKRFDCTNQTVIFKKNFLSFRDKKTGANVIFDTPILKVEVDKLSLINYIKLIKNSNNYGEIKKRIEDKIIRTLKNNKLIYYRNYSDGYPYNSNIFYVDKKSYNYNYFRTFLSK